MDRVLGLNWVGELGFVPLVLMTLAFPSVLARRLAYSLRGRADWDVLVYRGAHSHDYRPRDAVLIENHSSMEAAAQRAEVVSAQLLQRDELPSDLV